MSKLVVAAKGRWVGACGNSSTFLPPLQGQHRIRVSGLSKSQAEQLLDWLEANGYRDYDLAYSAGKAFTVSYAGWSEVL